MASAEIKTVISSFEFENSISSTRICNEFRFFEPRFTSLVEVIIIEQVKICAFTQ